MGELAGLLRTCRARNDLDALTCAHLDALIDETDPFGRTRPIHITGSALVVHRSSKRVLLRYHSGVGSFIQLGGHGDPGERDPFEIARREAEEESGLVDLSWPEAPEQPPVAQLVSVRVGATAQVAAHHHLDFRYLLFTEQPERAVAEHEGAPLRWVKIEQAGELSREANLLPLFALGARLA